MPIERRSLVMTAALALLAAEAWAQSATSTLQGTVADSAGQVVPGATVSVQSPSTGFSRSAVTTPAGVYVLNFMPPGGYTVTATMSGFKTVRQENVKLNVGEIRTLDFRLEVGGHEETITVTEDAPPLDRNSPAISTVIGATQIKELPNNGRHWSALMMLAPGAINTGSGTHTATCATTTAGPTSSRRSTSGSAATSSAPPTWWPSSSTSFPPASSTWSSWG